MLFLSRLSQAKGVDDLIAGFARSPRHRELPLVIAGRGPEAEELRARAAASPLADRIIFLDDVDDAEKPYLMAGCAAYVLPSKPRPEFVETFGIALVEKMLAGGGPVITTETGGIGEAVGDHAIIVPVDDPTRSPPPSTDGARDVTRRTRAHGPIGPGRTRCSSTGWRSSTGCSTGRARSRRRRSPDREPHRRSGRVARSPTGRVDD